MALTVTLFSSIFFFVNTFPKPATQPASQFNGQLTYAGKVISRVSVTHLAGPTLYNFSCTIYITSQAHPKNITKASYSLADGLGAGTVSWLTGQVWNVSLAAFTLTTPDNITVTIIAGGVLVYRQILPGTNPTIPPIFLQEGTNPANPATGQAFTVYAQIQDPFLSSSSTKVLLNISSLPGFGSQKSVVMTFNSGSGLWVSGSYTEAQSGTFFVSIVATDSNNLANSVFFPIVIGAAGGGVVGVELLTNTSAPVNNTPVTVIASVTNNGGVAGTASVTFAGPGTFDPTTASGSVASGATVGFSTTWTPSQTGASTISASVAIPGVGNGFAALNITVFPKILFIAQATHAGSAPSVSNESAYLANEITDAGFPYTSVWVDCAAASYPSGIRLTDYDVVVIDFGTNTSQASCTSQPGSSVESSIVTAAGSGVSFWIVGARAFGVSGCAYSQGTYLPLFGIRSSGSSCTTPTAFANQVSSLTWVTSSTLRADGISGSFPLNGNLSGATTFQTYSALALGSGTVYLRTGGTNIGIYAASGSTRQAALGADPALLGTAPTGTSLGNGTGAQGTRVAYNVLNFLCEFSTASSPGRAGTDFGVAEALQIGVKHSLPSTFYANVRSNGAIGGVVTATLFVNGAPALFQGQVVAVTTVLSGDGANLFLVLTWQAPSAGSFTLSVALSTSPIDLFTLNNVYSVSIINQPIKFT